MTCRPVWGMGSNLLTHKHTVFSHGFKSFSCNNVLYASEHKCCTSFVTFIPKYFTLFDTIVDIIVPLISCLGYSFQVGFWVYKTSSAMLQRSDERTPSS